jgi:hypothetical protein
MLADISTVFLIQSNVSTIFPKWLPLAISSIDWGASVRGSTLPGLDWLVRTT